MKQIVKSVLAEEDFKKNIPKIDLVYLPNKRSPKGMIITKIIIIR